jgi:hypothetical protein
MTTTEILPAGATPDGWRGLVTFTGNRTLGAFLMLAPAVFPRGIRAAGRTDDSLQLL